MRSPALHHGLVVAAVGLAGWGGLASGANPHRAEVLVQQSTGRDAHGPWGLQTVEAALKLRPWHEGYAEGREAIQRIGGQRRQALRRQPHEDGPPVGADGP